MTHFVRTAALVALFPLRYYAYLIDLEKRTKA
jgi:hypothetical protein